MTSDTTAMNDETSQSVSEIQSPDIQHLSQRLDEIERKLDSLIESLSDSEENEWITNSEVMELLFISERQLIRLVDNDVILNDAIRNIGTAKNPCFLFHRVKVMSQYLKRVAKTH